MRKFHWLDEHYSLIRNSGGKSSIQQLFQGCLLPFSQLIDTGTVPEDNSVSVDSSHRISSAILAMKSFEHDLRFINLPEQLHCRLVRHERKCHEGKNR